MSKNGAIPGLDGSSSVLHVVARSQGDPPAYYYRQWIDGSHWTAWTKIDLDIFSGQILPVVWNRRLYLFWAIINRKPDQTQADLMTGNQLLTTTPAAAKTHLEVQLAWSEFKGKKWLPKQIAPQTIVIREAIEPYQVTLKSSIDDPLLRIDIFIPKINADKTITPGTHYAEFVLGGAGNVVEAFVFHKTDLLLNEVGPETRNIGSLTTLQLNNLLFPSLSHYEGMTIIPDQSFPDEKFPARQRISQCWALLGKTDGSSEPIYLLKEADFYRLLIPHQTSNFDSTLPFFYEDGFRSYFIIPNPGLKTYTFLPFYHPFAPLFIRELNRGGIDALFSRELQINPTSISKFPAFDGKAFSEYYLPQVNVPKSYPAENVDFLPNAGYSIYNWELFFHVPFLIGESLSRNQQFEDAKRWYEYIFNPTNGTEDPVPNRYWVTKPFFNMMDYQAESIRKLMDLIHKKDESAVGQVEEWRDDPFNPHLIAQSRPVAYQRTIVMKYIDNLIAWGDQLFSQDTMESVNEATQMYILAAELLGPRPERVKPLCASSDKTYAELESEGLDALGNASVLAAENLLDPVQSGSGIQYGADNSSASGSIQGVAPADPETPKLPYFHTLYFHIPPNDQLLGYWDTVADRLFKIRHCMNIEGVKRQLALFAPPIDPGLLVRAAAAGLDLGSILNDSSAALPAYRFRVIIREALELCEMVRGFGMELLGALEKKDAEALALKRSGYEQKIQEQIRTVLQKRLDEAVQQIDVLAKQRKNIADRQAYYNQRKDEVTNGWEAAALDLQGGTLISDATAKADERNAAICNILPSASIGINGAGGSPSVTLSFGGGNFGSAFSAESGANRILSAISQTQASLSQIIGSYQRRKDDWGLQYTLATDELISIDSQSLAAVIRQGIAQKELDNHDTNIKMASDVADFLQNKYTNQELYDWMISQTSATYFQAYQLAYTLAKRAEQCFRRELGLSDSSYIQFGYWDSLKKGLLAGDKLLFDLQRLKSAYFSQNVREFELTKHISLLSIDPNALVELRSSPDHSCMINLPEILFDLENPGHYMRRIKSVGITVPSVAGPYTGVSMTLTLHDNHVRTSPISDNYHFYPDNLERFINDQGGVSAIVTSHAQNDRGLFELRYDDERYLPFEGGGAISSWSLRLNPVYPQFDYSTISDVILHMQYTARDGGDILRDSASGKVKAGLNTIALTESRTGLYCLISARHEFGTNWQKFLNPGSGDQILALDIAPDRFPFFTNGLNIKITGIDFLAKLANQGEYTLLVTPPGDHTTPKPPRTMEKDDELNGLHKYYLNSNSIPPLAPVGIGSISTPSSNLTWSLQLQPPDVMNYTSLSASEIDDLLLIIRYEVYEIQQPPTP